MTNWKVKDWAVYDLRIVQIKEIRLPHGCTISDGSIETHGQLIDRLRPLTLENKATIEFFDYWYKELRHIRGQSGFNYPDISSYFSDLAIKQIDEGPLDRSITDKGPNFVRAAREYLRVIDGIHLFRA